MATFLEWFFPRTQKKMSTLELFQEVYGSRATRSGVTVNWRTALDVATVLACCRVIAEGVSQIPLRVYRNQNGSTSPARDHPLFAILHRRPNAWQTSFEFRETIMFHMILTGNAFVWKGRGGAARTVTALEPIEPNRVTVLRSKEGVLTYSVRADDGAIVVFSADEIWHLRGPSWNSWIGLEIVQLAREAIGLSMAAETAHSNLHKAGTRIAGTYSVEGVLTPEKYGQLSQWLDRHSSAGDRSGRPLILDNGATWSSQTMSGVDAQHIETRKHQIEEICREFRVMPIMVGHADKTATYASAEQMFLAHVVHTLSPWYERIEQSAEVNLLDQDERGAGLYVKFTPNALMRGAAADRAAFYSAALGSGGSPAWMTANEIRALEELDTIDGGDVLHVPPKAANGKENGQN